MPEFPSDWVQRFGVNLVTAYPPSGGGRFRYVARLYPQPSFSTILNQILASDPEFKVHHIGPLVRVITGEGEYGAWVKIQGLREGSKAVRYVGAVFLGDFATTLDCIVIVPERFAEFEQRSLALLRSETFHMAKRPRQFFYVPPAGWQGIPSGLVANFYPPDFPNNLTTLVVPPAHFSDTDKEQTREATFAAAGAGLNLESSLREELTADVGVKGHLLRLQGRRTSGQELIYRELALFVVPPYSYCLRLETTAAARLGELREIFGRVAASLQPLPASGEPRAAERPSVNLLNYWVS